MRRVRLSDYEISAIKEVAKEVFGEKTRVLLFGSRTNLREKGGDIDLYVIPQDTENLFNKEITFKAKLMVKLGERKIDVIIQKNPHRPIEKVALETGVEL